MTASPPFEGAVNESTGNFSISKMIHKLETFQLANVHRFRRLHDDDDVEFVPDAPPGKFSVAMSAIGRKLRSITSTLSAAVDADAYDDREAFLRRWELRKHFFWSLKKKQYDVHCKVRGPITYVFVTTSPPALLKMAEQSKVHLPLRGTIWDIHTENKQPKVKVWTASEMNESQILAEKRRLKHQEKSSKVAPAESGDGVLLRPNRCTSIQVNDAETGRVRAYKWQERRKIQSAKMHSFPVDDHVMSSFKGCLVEPPLDFTFRSHETGEQAEHYTPEFDFERTKQFLLGECDVTTRPLLVLFCWGGLLGRHW